MIDCSFRISTVAPRSVLCALRYMFIAIMLVQGALISAALALEPGGIARVNTERLNLREGPSTSFAVVKEMPQNTAVIVNRIEDGWANISLEKAPYVKGWAGAKFLSSGAKLVIPAGSSPEEFFAAVSEFNGQEPSGTGYLSELDTHFAYYRFSKVGLALWRSGYDDQPARTWTGEDYSVSEVTEVDIDADGTHEIVFFSSGGGTGTFTVWEHHISWPRGAEDVTLGFSFPAIENHTMTWFDTVYELFSATEMKYGQDCKPTQYCPFDDTKPCRMAPACEMAKIREIRMSAPVLPTHLRDNPEWDAYLKRLYEEEGFVLVGGDVPEALTEIELQALEEVDTGEKPELSEERLQKIDDWLN